MKPIAVTDLRMGDYVLEMCHNNIRNSDCLIGQIPNNNDDITVLRNIYGTPYICGETYGIQKGFRYYLLTEEELIEHLLLETI